MHLLRLLTLLSFLVFPLSVQATTWHVNDGTGNDANTCAQAESSGTPKKTVEACYVCADADGDGAGDTCIVHGDGVGVIYAEEFRGADAVPGGTSWAAPFTMSVPSGEIIIFKLGAGAGSHIFSLGDASEKFIQFLGAPGEYNLIIDGDSKAHPGQCVKLHTLADDFRFFDGECRFMANSGFQVSATARRMHLKNVKIHDNGTTTGSHGVYFKGAENTIENSDVYNNSGYGVHIFSNDVTADDNIVDSNRLFDNINKAGVLAAGKRNLITNNQIWDNFEGIRATGGGGRDNEFYNNTIYSNTTDGADIRQSGNILKNNILFANGTQINNTGIGTVIENNIGSTLPTNLGNIDPLLNNPGADDFGLQAGSPAIDAGQTIAVVTVDFEGDLRPQGSFYDIGADERIQGGGDTQNPTTTITTPANNATVSGASVSYTADASDNVAVTSVDFRVDGNVISTDTTSPYTATWDTTPEDDGPHTLTTVAHDAVGRTGTSPAIAVTVDNLGSETKRFGENSTDDFTGVTEDASINAGVDVDNNFGTGSSILVKWASNSTGDFDNTGLLEFDISGLPNDAVVSNAFIELWVNTAANGNASTVYLYEASQAWTEAGATWNKYDGTTNWNTGGARGSGVDIVGTAGSATGSLATITFTGGEVAGIKKTFTGLGSHVNSKVASDVVSFVIHQASLDNANAFFRSSEHSTDGQRPKLTVVFTTAGGDVVKPVVTIDAPTEGATVSGATVAFDATCNDDVAVAGVQFKVDGVNEGAEDTGSPYEVVWDSEGVNDGNTILTAVCRDTSQNLATSSDRNVTVNNITDTSVFTSLHHRFREWARSVSTNTFADWLAAEDTNVGAKAGGSFAVVNLIGCTVDDCSLTGFQHYFNVDGGGYNPVTASCVTDELCYIDDNSLAQDSESIMAARLTNPHSCFTSGQVVGKAVDFPAIDLPQNCSTELQGMFDLKTSVAIGTVICILPREEGGTDITHDQTACLTVTPAQGSSAAGAGN